jgi:hypothetical protein
MVFITKKNFTLTMLTIAKSSNETICLKQNNISLNICEFCVHFALEKKNHVKTMLLHLTVILQTRNSIVNVKASPLNLSNFDDQNIIKKYWNRIQPKKLKKTTK